MCVCVCVYVCVRARACVLSSQAILIGSALYPCTIVLHLTQGLDDSIADVYKEYRMWLICQQDQADLSTGYLECS